jgi:ketosteroid isomerase-like protein
MSTENVDLIRGHWQAWEDDRDIETLVQGWAPDIEWDLTRFEGWTSAMHYRGLGDVLAFLVEYMSAWTGYETDAQRFVDGGDRVFVEVRESGQIDGVETARTWAMVCTVRDLKTVRVEMFTDVAEAERSLARETDQAV